ncbi:MAG: COG4280 domain-containing protein [Burkholderiales bacterium]
MLTWIQGGPQMAAAFLGSSVEAVEAMTIVLAAGIVRGWRSALAGTAAGLVTLAAIIAIFGPAIAAVPIDVLQIVVGTLLLLFGIRWLRKAILRSAGVIALHDEDAIYAEETRALSGSHPAVKRWDSVAMLTAYKAIVLEGVEVVVIVIGVGAVGNMLVPASIGALAACALVVIAAAILHRPLARVPENALKYVVGVMMTAFGLFWFGEGIGIEWPYADAALLGLMGVLFVGSMLGIRLSRYVQAVRSGPLEARI